MSIEMRGKLRAGFFERKKENVLAKVNGDAYTIHDISIGGMQIVSEQPHALKKDSEVKIEFGWSDRVMRDAEVRGSVKWAEEKTAGIQFIDLHDDMREYINELMADGEMSEGEKMAYQARLDEIQQFSEHAFQIIVGVIAATTGVLGAELAFKGAKYFYLLPLLLIDMGFYNYNLQIKRIRRTGNYIRYFIEPGFRNRKFKWEENLYHFRHLSQTLKPEKDKHKFYSLGYYYVALWLSCGAFLIEIYRILNQLPSNVPVFVNLWNWVAGLLRVYPLSDKVLLLVAVFWFGYELPKIRREGKNFEGANDLDEEMKDLWKHVKQRQDGVCRDDGHFQKILRIFWNKTMPRSAEELVFKTDCSHPSCIFNGKIKKLHDLIVGAEYKPNRFRLSFSMLVAAAALVAVFAGYRFRHLVSPLNVQLPLLFLLLVPPFVIKIRMRRIYWKVKNDGRTVWIGIDKDMAPYFPPKYMKPKTRSMLRWFWYGLTDRTWGREKSSVYILGRRFDLSRAGQYARQKWEKLWKRGNQAASPATKPPPKTAESPAPVGSIPDFINPFYVRSAE